MPDKVKTPCLMCRKIPAKKLSAYKGRNRYVNGQNVTMYCSVRCAANWALIWHVDHTEDMHVCPATGKWEHCSEEDCIDCSPVDEE